MCISNGAIDSFKGVSPVICVIPSELYVTVLAVVKLRFKFDFCTNQEVRKDEVFTSSVDSCIRNLFDSVPSCDIELLRHCYELPRLDAALTSRLPFIQSLGLVTKDLGDCS